MQKFKKHRCLIWFLQTKKYTFYWLQRDDDHKIKLLHINCEPIYDKKFLKTQKRPCRYDTTDFHPIQIPKVDSNYTYLVEILINFVLKKDKNFYLQAFLKECKYIEKEKEVIRHITDD